MTIRQLPPSDIEHCLKFASEVWTDQYTEAPFRKVLAKSFANGQVLGAFDGEKWIGLRVSGVETQTILRSYLLGVIPEYKRSGVAKALSLAGREDAIARGITMVVGRMDLLDAGVTGTCIEGLGLTAQGMAYRSSMCGIVWDLQGPRAKAAAAGNPIPRQVSAIVEIPMPADQSILTGRLSRHFDRGLSVVGFAREAGKHIYQLGRA